MEFFSTILNSNISIVGLSIVCAIQTFVIIVYAIPQTLEVQRLQKENSEINNKINEIDIAEIKEIIENTNGDNTTNKLEEINTLILNNKQIVEELILELQSTLEKINGNEIISLLQDIKNEFNVHHERIGNLDIEAAIRQLDKLSKDMDTLYQKIDANRIYEILISLKSEISLELNSVKENIQRNSEEMMNLEKDLNLFHEKILTMKEVVDVMSENKKDSKNFNTGLFELK